MSIILGIDPGSRVTGFGVVKLHSLKSGVLESKGYGVIKLDDKASFPLRMKELGHSLQVILKKYKPDVVAIEKIFLGRNADSAFKLGHARGVAMYESACYGAEIFEYATRIVKKGVTGKGGATKEEVQLMLQRLLHIRSLQSLDASDALALAVHHAYGAMTKDSVARGLKRQKAELSV